MGEQFNTMQEHKHNNKECLCYHCNELISSQDKLKRYEIKDRGYQSEFVDEVFTIQLCEDCVKYLEIEEEWFDNNVCFDEVNGNYLYEYHIINLIEMFPIHNQEYIYNCYNVAFCGHVEEKRMSREDWISNHM